MTQQSKDQHQKPAQSAPFPTTESVDKAKHQAEQHQVEQQEVAGRHKNDGQKDHKGAR